MDAKGRIALPVKQRELLQAFCGGQLVVTIDIQSRSLMVYPLSTWESIERELQDLPAMNPDVRRVQRLLIGYASDLEFDGSGRVLLPQSLRDYASLEKKLVLVGQGKKLELWSEEVWLSERDKWLEEAIDVSVMPEELLSISL
jgi:MraZ protein|tara:strand:+ start:58 stop:486 length:429 start_codon:yes stop_codon:yes gene_type:complete